MFEDAADELDVVGGGADGGVHAGAEERAHRREAGGQRHAIRRGVSPWTGGSGVDGSLKPTWDSHA